MGREIKRVPLDFDWPLNEVWEGFVFPDRLNGKPCPDCEGGVTHFGHWLANFAYVISMLATDVHGNDRDGKMHPWLTEFSRAHGHFDTTRRFVIDRPSKDALEFFHGIIDRSYAIKRIKGDPNGEYDYDELYSADRVPPVEQVGSSIGYSSSGAGGGNIQHALLDVLYDAAGTSSTCPTCEGEGVLEEYPGQKDERDAWNAINHYEESGPPTGDGWQLWETVSEGSPISPVFDCAEALATWMTGPGYTKWSLGHLPDYESALRFVKAGWAPSMIFSPEHGVEDGVTAVGRERD